MKLLVDVDLQTLFVGGKVLIPAGMSYTITAGPTGCKYVIGEK
jgi:hypothetical protein